MNLILSVLPGTFAICRMEAGSETPEWVHASSFLSVTRTSEELSVVCDQDLVPEGVKAARDWAAFKVEGPLDFSLTGIVASIATVLAAQQIPIFVISTFDTDYILVQRRDFDRAKVVLGGVFTVRG